MQLEVKKHLADVFAAADRVLRFTAGRMLTDYSTDELLRAAVERQFVTIGEARVRVRYDSLAHETVWDIVQNHVPRLRGEAANLLAR